MAADETTVKKKVTEILNASAGGTFSVTIDPYNFDRVAEDISEAVREGAMMIARAIVANSNHIHRNLFVSATPTSLTNGGELPDMAGEFDVVEIKSHSAGSFNPAQKRDIQQINSFRNDTQRIYDTSAHNTATSALSGYYATGNGRFYFTGDSAQGYFPVIVRSSVASLIPDEYESVWVALAVGFTVKEGDNLVPIANYYRELGLAELPVISSMGVISKLPVMEDERKARGNS